MLIQKSFPNPGKPGLLQCQNHGFRAGQYTDNNSRAQELFSVASMHVHIDWPSSLPVSAVLGSKQDIEGGGNPIP